MDFDVAVRSLPELAELAALSPCPGRGAADDLFAECLSPRLCAADIRSSKRNKINRIDGNDTRRLRDEFRANQRAAQVLRRCSSE